MIIIFREVVKYEEFLTLPPEELIDIISSNDLNAPLEQNVSKLKLHIFIFYYFELNMV